MREEYDFSRGERGKYARRYAEDVDWDQEAMLSSQVETGCVDDGAIPAVAVAQDHAAHTGGGAHT